MGNFLAVQWLELCAFTAGFNPWLGTYIQQGTTTKKERIFYFWLHLQQFLKVNERNSQFKMSVCLCF